MTSLFPGADLQVHDSYWRPLGEPFPNVPTDSERDRDVAAMRSALKIRGFNLRTCKRLQKYRISTVAWRFDMEFDAQGRQWFIHPFIENIASHRSIYAALSDAIKSSRNDRGPANAR